jgi:integrase/recombinase XerD
MSKITFTTIAHEYIEEKRAIGNKFKKAEQTLNRIISLQHEIDKGKPILSKKLFKTWAQKTSWETDANRSQRISVLRGLSTYMIRQGFQAVVIPKKYAAYAEYNYIPYIFTDKQLGNLLHAIDQYSEECTWIYHRLEFPIVFRLLIGSGLRITETLAIQKNDYYSAEQSILLKKTKNQKERIIPIAESLAQRIENYIKETEKLLNFVSSELLFPNPDGRQYSSDRFYYFFRKFLWQAGIPHRGRGYGPRLHDLRHTYAVRVINKWVLNGKNLTTCLPYLAIYMGHSGLKASEHYLRLTTQMFPELLSKVNHYYSWVIPEVEREA